MFKLIKRLLLLILLLAVLFAGVKVFAFVKEAKSDTSSSEETGTTNWATESPDDIILPEGVDSTAKFTAQRADGGLLYLVFNGIWTRETGYFQAPNGSLTLTATGSAEGTQRYKIAVWKRVDGGTAYVPHSTGYIRTDGKNYRYTVTGLDPEASYRLTVSYDSSRYYLYGMVKVEGIG